MRRPRGAVAQSERMICNCHKVSEPALREAIQGGDRTLEAVCAAIKAGTGCGSCRSEVAQIVARHAPAEEPPAGRIAAAG